MTAGRPYTVGFHDALGSELGVVGGKGANLGRLALAGFNVPPGYTITTQAYRDFVATAGLAQVISDQLAAFDPADLDAVERSTAGLRDALTAAPVPPAMADAITVALEKLGPDVFVAVRSSGTAEDLAEASFAGQHDTYLDVQGPDAVLDAVKACWASLWTARAVIYRHRNGIDNADIAIGVVVQTMVASDVSGVLFTADPVTATTEEMVINASWGLGEAIVSGLTEPDEFTVRNRDLAVKARQLGGKAVRVVRAPSGRGTVEEPVPAGERDRFSLTDDQVRALGQLGRRVTDHYEGIPQDIEWALAGDELFVLQARPITGVSFSWDEDVEPWQLHPQDDAVWTRAWADAYNGPATPLWYSTRFRSYCEGMDVGVHVHGVQGLEKVQWYKYHRGVPYYHGDLEAPLIVHHVPKACRPHLDEMTTPQVWEETLAGRFRTLPFLRTQARSWLWGESYGLFTFMKAMSRTVYAEDTTFADGIPDAELRILSDTELLRYTAEITEAEADYCRKAILMVVPATLGMGAFQTFIERWYRGDNPNIVADLFTGTVERTVTMKETLWLWDLATRLRDDPDLLALFETNPDGAFFDAVAGHSDAGQAWFADYSRFRAAHAHRGHAERDLYHPRRSEDPSLDYQALRTMLNTRPGHDPAEGERRANQRREAAVADVVASLRRSPLGRAKVKIFLAFQREVEKAFVLRDDERHWIDRVTMTMKRCFKEIGRRLADRGVLEGADDVFFLGTEEIHDLLRGRECRTLTRAKVIGRRANYEEAAQSLSQRPMYVQHFRPLDLGSDDRDDASGVLRGVARAAGSVTGRARIVRRLQDIGQVQHGEILVCNATDPGWTPVFMTISGIVVETGGILAHAACLSREFGLPAVQLPSAMARIPDGATITVNGDTGEVRLAEISRPGSENPTVQESEGVPV